MNKNETKLLSFKTTNFFDIEKLYKKNPELYAELCEKYPIKHKECVFAIIYKKAEDEDLIKETQPEQKPFDEPKQKSLTPKGRENIPTIEDVVKEVSDQIINGSTDGEPIGLLNDESKVTEFPEDFQPLYKVDEQIDITLDNGNSIDPIRIKHIRLDPAENKYFYLVEVLLTGELVVYEEDKLTEIEI